MTVSAAIVAAMYHRQTEAAAASSNNKQRPVDVILGAQWGDEGKGKLVDILAGKYDICARVAGGSNAGHTIVVGGTKYKFHLCPSGILNPSTHCVVGHGVVVHLRGLLAELRTLEEAGVDYKGRLHLSDRAHIVFDFHQQVDAINEQRLGGDMLGTTKKGIGPAYGSKIQRNGLRIGDLSDMEYFETKLRALINYLQMAYPELKVDVEAELEYYKSIREEILSMTTDTISLVHQAMADNKTILVEGANATMIDIDYGTYPFVSSSNPSVGSTCTGLGVPPNKLGCVTGIVKAYSTRVGAG
jgi:adenylosuccinate synthase